MKTTRDFDIITLFITLLSLLNFSLLSDAKDTTTTQIISAEGYSVEEHQVRTEDGHLLTMHRIPGSASSPVVFVQHGFLGSSSDWVLTGKKLGLPFLLADQGYDVWLGNARGTKYSSSHLNYTTSDSKFWDFSWEEMGTYDLPAELSYVTKLTKQKIIYIGHSMGTTMFYVMAIEKPKVAANVKAMFSLAPVAFQNHTKGTVKLLFSFPSQFQSILKLLGDGEFLPKNNIISRLINKVCNVATVTQKLCVYLMFTLYGFDEPQFNYKLLPKILSHLPASSSVKTETHYSQVAKSGRFQRYDYGEQENLKRYNSTEPPEYDLSKIQVPIGLFWSQNDKVATPADVKALSELLPNLILNHKVDYEKFSHTDFLWAIDVYELLYKDVLVEVNKYR